MSDASLSTNARPDCPNCGAPGMRLVAAKPGDDGRQQRMFSCLSCSHLETIAVRPGDGVQA